MSASPAPARRAAGPPLLGTAAFVVVVVAMHLAAGVVSMVLLSFLVTVLVAPVAAGLRRRGWPGWAALLAAVACYVAALATVGVIAGVGLFRLLHELPSDMSEIAGRLQVDVPPDVAQRVAGAFGSVAESVAQSALAGLAVIGYSVIIVAYLLLETHTAADRIRWAFNGNEDVVQRAAALTVRLRAYLVARAVLGLIAAVLDTAVLILLGIPSALLWGVLAFLMSFVPNVGFLISMIPPAVLALIVGGIPTALFVVVAYAVINVTTDYLVQPRFVGTAVDLSPLIVTISLLFWTLVLGGAGAVFAVPLTIIVVSVADAFEGTRPLSRMFASDVPTNGAIEPPREATASHAAASAPADPPGTS